MPIKNTELLLQGRNDQGQFLGRKEQVDALRAAVQRLSAEQNTMNAQVAKALGGENFLLKQKNKFQAAITKSIAKQLQQAQKAGKEIENRLKAENKLIQQNLKLSTQLNNLRMKAARSAGGGSLFGSGGLARSIASIGVLALAVRQIKEIADSRLGTYLNNGSGATSRIAAMGGQGIAPASKFGALNEFQGSGLSQFIIGQTKEIQSGLLKAQEELSKNVGAGTANELLEGINKSFGSDSARRREFFEGVGSKGLSKSLSQFASQYNLPEFSRASNALTSAEDPALKLRSEFLDVLEQLKLSFEKLVVTVGTSLVPLMEKLTPTIKRLLDVLGGLSSSQVAVGAGAVVAARYGLPALIKGGASGAAGGAAKGLVGRAIGSTVALPLIAGMAHTNARDKYAKVATDAMKEQSIKHSRAIKRDTDAIEKRSRAESRATEAVRKTAQVQDSLSAKILKRDSLIMPTQVAEGLANLSREKLGLSQLSVFGTKQAPAETQNLIKSLNDQKALLEQSLATVDEDTSQGKIDANNLRTSITSLEREVKANSIGLQTMPLEFQTTLSELKRAEMQSKSITPYGLIGAFPELQAVNSSLQKEIEILNQIAASTELTAFEQVRVKQAIISREIEQKQNLRSLMEAYRDMGLQQVAMSGAGHRSIIVTQDQNLGIGLRKGMISSMVPREIVGNINPKITPLLPKTAAEILGHNPFSSSRGAVKAKKGSSSAESMKNLGEMAIEIAKQLRDEFNGIHNELAEPIGSYASGRLNSVQ